MRVFWSVLALCMLGAGVWIYTSRLNNSQAQPQGQTTGAPFEAVKPDAPQTPATPAGEAPPIAKDVAKPTGTPSASQGLDEVLGTNEKPSVDLNATAATPTKDERAAEADRDLLYTVQPGETLLTVANKFFSEPTLGPRLGAYNAEALKSSGFLTPGMQIRIPARRDTLMRPEYAQAPAPSSKTDTAAKPAETKPDDGSKPAETTAAKPGSNSPREEKAEADGEAKIEVKADGTKLVDDKYVLKGEGTAEKPYEITWEYLTSASSVYDPSKGKKKVPGRITMLDGKRVKITGYIAYPLYVDEPKELLSMLNQWDGCCIGTPPTPYDAIEVHLSGTASKEDRLASYGSVIGKFQVKPYLVGEWLVGLYVMENADLKARGHGGE